MVRSPEILQSVPVCFVRMCVLRMEVVGSRCRVHSC